MLKLYRFLKPYVIPVIAVVFLVFFEAMANLYMPTLMSDIVNNGITNNDTNYIMETGGFMLLVALGGSVCAILSGYLGAHSAMGFGEILRNKIFSHVSQYTLFEFDKFGTPSLITRTTLDVIQIQRVTMVIMRMIIRAPIMAIGGIVMAVSKDQGLSWVIIVVIPILGSVILVLASRAFPLFRAIQKKIDRINLVLRESLTGIRVIRAFNRTENKKKQFDAANTDFTETSIKVNRMMAVLMPVMMLVMNFTTIAIIWFGSIRIDHGTTNVGDMMAFLQYAMQILISMLMASMMFILLPRAQASAERINEILDVQPGIKDTQTPVVLQSRQKGTLEFRNVTFRYSGAEHPALCNISFTTMPGEITAIIGSTGSGKTSLINLIPRFYEPESGSILLNGNDIRTLPQADLRGKIGFVPQTAVLFTGTVAENIRYGKPDATDQEVKHAADVAQASEFITGMEKGFDSVIAQGGKNVSGGQKQRLAIARALVRRPEVYLFDDSFSALDFKTDARLRAALRKETKESSVIIVGQRVASIMDAHQIIVLEKGRIAGIGPHKELYRTCKVYQEIVASQLSEEELS